jgi:hypothetical protein
MEMKIMFKTIGFKTISATMVSLSMLAGAVAASPVVTAFAKTESFGGPNLIESRRDLRLDKPGDHDGDEKYEKTEMPVYFPLTKPQNPGAGSIHSIL